MLEELLMKYSISNLKLEMDFKSGVIEVNRSLNSSPSLMYTYTFDSSKTVLSKKNVSANR